MPVVDAPLAAAYYTLGRKLHTTDKALATALAAQATLTAQNTKLRAALAQDARHRKSRVLRPVHPSVGLECEYRRRLQALIEEMNTSVTYWLKCGYRANTPEVTELKQEDKVPLLAEDALPANVLRRAVRRLAKRWQKRFNEASTSLAQWFALSNRRRSVAQLHNILKQGGWSVQLQLSQAQRDILAAAIHENVGLIRSIPQQYFTQIEGMVMRSVQTGRDLHQLTRDLQRQFSVTKKRATLIARDQNNKVTAVLHRTHQMELGITKAVWVHSHAGRVPRRTHLANDGEEYDVRQGWFDPDPKVRRRIMPGELINCRCFSRSVIPGFS